ncbi:hypothetical protein HTVC304P_gp22 [Pelagibacter phage HTVC304P]|jgi:hypothetical protein|nr:hypothetical protein P201_gp21 [Pelagibacter phage HTVC201P]WMM95005.1 hypothetical protein HTVC304P_gp22 [Pelagibacter phage HTVC304P]
MADMIQNPPHYANNEIEPIDYIIANKLTYCEGNVVKYITRWRGKGGLEDLKKAKQYIDFIIEKEGVPKVTESKDA